MDNNNPEYPKQPKNLLEEANGNYLLAFSLFIDRLNIPGAVKTIIKSIFLGLALAIALTALFWPFLMR